MLIDKALNTTFLWYANFTTVNKWTERFETFKQEKRTNKSN